MVLFFVAHSFLSLSLSFRMGCAVQCNWVVCFCSPNCIARVSRWRRCQNSIIFTRRCRTFSPYSFPFWLQLVTWNFFTQLLIGRRDCFCNKFHSFNRYEIWIAHAFAMEIVDRCRIIALWCQVLTQVLLLRTKFCDHSRIFFRLAEETMFLFLSAVHWLLPFPLSRCCLHLVSLLCSSVNKSLLNPSLPSTFPSSIWQIAIFVQIHLQFNWHNFFKWTSPNQSLLCLAVPHSHLMI